MELKSRCEYLPFSLILFPGEVIHTNEETVLPSYCFCPNGHGPVAETKQEMIEVLRGAVDREITLFLSFDTVSR
jgi:hypothetical protein